ncbi:UNVERIFIED_CONTAM: site-specific recombinase XerD [Williamsia faeni]
MAWVKVYETKQRRNGKPVKTYRVIWKEVERDADGLPIPEDPAKPEGRKKSRNRQESFATREAAESRRDELNVAKHVGGTSALAKQRKAGDLPFGFYGRAWLDSKRVKVAQGRLKQRTLDDYENVLQRYSLDRFGGTAIAGITPHDCEEFLAQLVGRGLAPKTVTHAWLTFRAVCKYAVRHGAIASSPTDQVDFATGHSVGDHDKFEHHPLTAQQVGEVAALVGERYPVYELMTLFLAYSGVRKAECAGLEVRDLEFTTAPGQDTRCVVAVRRTKDRTGGRWVTSTPKSRRSRRSVPLPAWLAERLRQYLAADHPRAHEAEAPLWPNRRNGGGHRTAGQRYAVPLDWSQPLELGTFFETVLAPALVQVGLPVSAPATATEPAVRGVRLHDFGRHTFATMQLSAGVHFMQVSQWLGHGSYTLTLDTYGEWIPEEDGGAGNNLPQPMPVHDSVPGSSNVIELFGR